MVKQVGNYHLHSTLGTGTFGKVKLAVHVTTKQKCAMKIIDKDMLVKDNMTAQLKREINALKVLKHPNIVELIEVMQTSKNIYIVLELVTGGELFDKIVHARKFTEDIARRYFQQIVGAVAYCHEQGIAHRDLKPENLLLSATDEVKITDFGLSQLQSNGDILSTVCGTPNYVAPEVLRDKGYNGFLADSWSCGIILYVMLCGYLPFDDSNMTVLFQKIDRAEYSIPSSVPKQPADLIRRILVTDVADRPTVDQILRDPWVQHAMPSSLRSVPPPLRLDEDSAMDSTSALPTATVTEAADASPSSAAAAAGNVLEIDAFTIASMVAGVTDLAKDISNFTGNSIKRATRFLVYGKDPQDAVERGLVALGAHPQRNGSTIKGFVQRKTLVVFTTKFYPVKGVDLALMEMNRLKGDIFDFHAFYRDFIASLGSRVAAAQDQAAK